MQNRPGFFLMVGAFILLAINKFIPAPVNWYVEGSTICLFLFGLLVDHERSDS